MKKIILITIVVVLNIHNSFSQEVKKYIFIGHPYTFKLSEGLFDTRCVALDLPQNYDRIWLGGDVLAKSLKTKENVEAVDEVFNISAPGNHWTMGNHDAWGFNWEWYYEVCGRPTYYAHYQDDITTIVINTNINPSDCEQLDDQYRMIENVCDTISESLALIFLCHHDIFGGVPGFPSPASYSNIPKPFWNSNCFDPDHRWFVNSIYPMLKTVKDRGVEVICVMGDLGAFTKTFYILSSDDIHFMGCGLWNSAYSTPEQIEAAGKDKVLIFEHNVSERTLTVAFHDIDSLVAVNKTKKFIRR
ncbi:MAG: hypothetical protein PHE56_01470 [Bacteroidales bacterium]|nr:hypothetical protein [Bacteroidales bacterium]